MPPHDLAPFMLGMTLILCAAGVIVLRPLTKRLGDLIEARNRERAAQSQLPGAEIARLTEVVNRLTDRIESLEERQDFSERLLDSLEGPDARGRLRDPTQR
jgi:hypothetical protein